MQCCNVATLAVVSNTLWIYLGGVGVTVVGSLGGDRIRLQAPVLEGELRGLSAWHYSPAYRSIFWRTLPVPKNESQNWQEQNRDFKKIFSEYFPIIYISYANTTRLYENPTPGIMSSG